MTNILTPDFAKQAKLAFKKPTRPATPPTPEGIAITGFFASDLKFNSRSGMAQITLEIPWEFRDKAQLLLEYVDWPVNLYIEPQQHEDGY